MTLAEFLLARIAEDEAQWAWEHTACEHDDIVQTLAGATWCADCGQALGGITPR